MAKTIQIFEDDNKIYEGTLSVNTAILKGQMYKNLHQTGKCTQFTIKISNGKNQSTNEWYKPTYADCTAFGTLGEQILERYIDKDEIWIIGKFYCNTKNSKTYKGFNVKEVINIKKEPSKNPNDDNYIGNEDLPF